MNIFISDYDNNIEWGGYALKVGIPCLMASGKRTIKMSTFFNKFRN
jgi:hypothetical protein